jgi:hypothetical protein
VVPRNRIVDDRPSFREPARTSSGDGLRVEGEAAHALTRARPELAVPLVLAANHAWAANLLEASGACGLPLG